MYLRLFICLIIPLFIFGCSEVSNLGATPEPVIPDSPTITPAASSALPDTTPTSTEFQGPIRLKIWVPPEFDPTADTPEGKMLNERLQEFIQRRPSITDIDVRVKAPYGPGGLLDALTTTSAAAPLALPDLIALPYPELETAALKGLLHPSEKLDMLLEEEDWFDFSRQLSQIQGRSYGLPFAGDGIIQVYRTDVLASPHMDWNAVLNSSVPLVFAAADPNSFFTLAQYQSNGGEISDEMGRPFLELDDLREVFSFYEDAQQTGVMPNWLTQYQSDQQVWDSFIENRSDNVITWASRILGEKEKQGMAAQIPTPDGAPFSLITGWVWSIPVLQPQQQELAIELAEFLTEGEFSGKWSEAAGYLPTRSSALQEWTSSQETAWLEEIINTGILLPPVELLTSLGPLLQNATVQVINQQSDPQTASNQIVESLTGP